MEFETLFSELIRSGTPEHKAQGVCNILAKCGLDDVEACQERAIATNSLHGTMRKALEIIEHGGLLQGKEAEKPKDHVSKSQIEGLRREFKGIVAALNARMGKLEEELAEALAGDVDDVRAENAEEELVKSDQA